MYRDEPAPISALQIDSTERLSPTIVISGRAHKLDQAKPLGLLQPSQETVLLRVSIDPLLIMPTTQLTYRLEKPK